MTEAESEVVGYLDGYRRGGFEGWAWMPSRPEHRLEIEIVVNGFVIARTMASDYRADLRAAGVGDGRHAFVVPLELDTARSGPVKVLVRTVEGVLLRHGEISVGYEPPSSEEEAEVFQAFVAAVLGSPSAVASAGPIERDPTINFIIHAATRTETLATTQGAPEYSYNFVMNAFAPLLKRFGAVHLVEDPAREVDLLYKAHLSRGENCLFLSFAPPHKTVLGLLCPTIPVVAWEFPTIPSAIWDGDARHDWRRVLRQTGRAITLSKFAADAVKATMGADSRWSPSLLRSGTGIRRCRPCRFGRSGARRPSPSTASCSIRATIVSSWRWSRRPFRIARRPRRLPKWLWTASYLPPCSRRRTVGRIGSIW